MVVKKIRTKSFRGSLQSNASVAPKGFHKNFAKPWYGFSCLFQSMVFNLESRHPEDLLSTARWSAVENALLDQRCY